MIVVDTSALVAILRDEVASAVCLEALQTADRILISAGTLTEAMIVSSRRGFGAQMATLIRDFGFEVVAVDHPAAKRAAAAYDRWGKGFHPARLNFGDTFAYALAEEQGCPLLYIGDDFARTDIRAAL